jgi:endonuclease/exonuclease/phosphatase family metal-dependent hydrolase
MPLTITNRNVQNLSGTDPVLDEKLGFLIGTLQALGSDVVALQEVLDVDALQQLADGLGFHHFAGTPDSRGNRVAFLTRDPLPHPPQSIDQWRLAAGVQIRGIDGDGNVVVVPQVPRPALLITVAHGGVEVDIITAHFKSKLLTFGGNFSTTDETLRAQPAYAALERRAAEATTLREHVSNLLAAGRRVVVLGDFNDGPQAATTQILHGPPGSQPRGPEDAALASGAFQRADTSDGRRLFNIVMLMPEQTRWSRRHNGQNELLDHILCSEGLMPRDGARARCPP